MGTKDSRKEPDDVPDEATAQRVGTSSRAACEFNDSEEPKTARSQIRIPTAKRVDGPPSTQDEVSGARPALRTDHFDGAASSQKPSGVRQVSGKRRIAIPPITAIPPIGTRPLVHAPAALPQVTLRVLLVDDEPTLLRAHQRMLQGPGVTCDLARDGETATALLAKYEYDVVVSDVCMPKMDGVSLLREVRRHHPDVPVILVTASPTMETAVAAVEHGALRYLYKPLDPEKLRQTVQEAARLSRLARLKRDALAEVAQYHGRIAPEHLSSAFNEALDALWIAYQPIVSVRNQQVVAFEALCRTSSAQLPGPPELLDAAERLGRVLELGRVIRHRAIAILPDLADDVPLFVNLHPQELFDDRLLDGRDLFALNADRVVLEVTERRSLDSLGDIAVRSRALKDHGYRIAVDDMGSGYSGLSSFAQLTPSVIKLDMSLVRDIDRHLVKRRLVASMVQLCAEMNTLVVVEGVETHGERDTLIDCGCDHMQGFLFGVPAERPIVPHGFQQAGLAGHR